LAGGRPLPSLDAVPQRTTVKGDAAAIPYLTPVDPLTFAAMKEQARLPRDPAPGKRGNAQPPTRGLAVPKNRQFETVAPAEITFTGISNASCAAVNGGLNFRPADVALAVGDIV